MASVEDYSSGKILAQAKQALSVLQDSRESLAGSPLGEMLLNKIGTFEPKLLPKKEAEQMIQAATHCAVGERVCYQNHPQSEFTEAVFLDQLAEAMVAAGKAQMVTKAAAMATIEKYKRNPKIISKVSGKPMELCCTCPDMCIYWNMEKRGLRCIQRSASTDSAAP